MIHSDIENYGSKTGGSPRRDSVMQGPSMNRVDSLKGINLYYFRDTNLTLYLALKLVFKML